MKVDGSQERRGSALTATAVVSVIAVAVSLLRWLLDINDGCEISPRPVICLTPKEIFIVVISLAAVVTAAAAAVTAWSRRRPSRALSLALRGLPWVWGALATYALFVLLW